MQQLLSLSSGNSAWVELCGRQSWLRQTLSGLIKVKRIIGNKESVCFTEVWYCCLGATTVKPDTWRIAFFPGLLQSSHGQSGAYSHRQKLSVCENDMPSELQSCCKSLKTCAKINFHQRTTGTSIPPSPGGESSVFWREHCQEANVESTTVDITQPVCQVYRKVLKVFSPRVQHEVMDYRFEIQSTQV